MMPLASATAINFSAPLFATLASVVFLKESVGPARWAALVVGFIGVLIVTNPGSETFQIGALYALGNSLLFGTVTVGVRGMTRTELAKTLTMYQLIWLSIFYGLTLPFFFVTPAWSDMPLIVANGVCNMLGQYWWTRAIHLAPTSAVVPFQYLSLIWAMGFGFALWGDVPTIGLSDRLGDRRRLRPVPALARDAAEDAEDGTALKKWPGFRPGHRRRIAACSVHREAIEQAVAAGALEIVLGAAAARAARRMRRIPRLRRRVVAQALAIEWPSMAEPAVLLVQFLQVRSSPAGKALAVGGRAGEDVMPVRLFAAAVDDLALLAQRGLLGEVVAVAVQIVDALGDHRALGILPRTLADAVAGVHRAVALRAEISVPGLAGGARRLRELAALRVGAGEPAEVGALARARRW